MASADAAWEGLPGAELVVRGLAQLARGAPGREAWLLRVAAPRLRPLGVAVPEAAAGADAPEAALYALLSAEAPQAAHAQFNELRRRLVSFAEALEMRRERAAAAAAAAAPGP